MKHTTIFFIMLCIIILGCIGFWYWRDAVFSKEILKLEILGQDLAKMGDEIEYMVKYKNNGNFTLEKPKIIFELPENSLTEDGKTRLQQDLSDIYPGAESSITFKTRLLGKENDMKVAKATISYIPHNLSVRYESDTSKTTKINIVPITLIYDLPSVLEKDKEIVYAINYFSNIDYPLEHLSIKLDPTSSFTVTSSAPVSLDNIEWRLPTLQKSQGGRITIKGRVTAGTSMPLHFSARLGMWVNGTFIVLKETNQDAQAQVNSVLTLSQTVNQSPDEVKAKTYTVTWQVGNGDNNVHNVKVKAVLPDGVTLGDSLNPESEAPHFSFDTASRQIIWLAGDLLARNQTTLSFQVTLPTTGFANIISQATVSGEDQSSGITIQSSAPAINE